MNRGANHTLTKILLVFVALATGVPAKADVIVSVASYGFSPESVYIGVGEAVYWVVGDDQGPYTISSFSGDWSPRYLYDEGDSAGLRFNEAGDYEYYDAFTFNSGFVHVQNGISTTNVPPTGTISAPTDGATFSAPASFSVSVSASDPDDGVMDVEFYLGNELIDDVWSEPYITSVTNLVAGSYILKAIIYDYSGETSTQTITVQVVEGTTSKPCLSVPTWVSGQLQLRLTGLSAGRNIVLQSSPALVSSASWTSLQTNAVTGPSMVLTPAADGGTKFFRVIQLP